MSHATTQTVKLNVGGRVFETTRQTLAKSEFLSAALDRWAPPTAEVFFVDRCPKAFHHVLALMRNPDYAFPQEHVGELDFYLVAKPNQIVESVDSQMDKIQRWVEHLSSRLDAVVNGMTQLNNFEQNKLHPNTSNWPECKKCYKGVYKATAKYCIDHKNCKHDCWDPQAWLLVRPPDGRQSWQAFSDVRAGDWVMAVSAEELDDSGNSLAPGEFVEVLEVRRSPPVDCKKMCLLEGVWFTHGHPVFQDGKWSPARDLAPTVVRKKVELCNLLLAKPFAVCFQTGVVAATVGMFPTPLTRTQQTQ